MHKLVIECLESKQEAQAASEYTNKCRGLNKAKNRSKELVPSSNEEHEVQHPSAKSVDARGIGSVVLRRRRYLDE
ncbi:UNVERIFIED_CONTAM: hypothetical protein Sradi_4015700 [Sesamum radiatum]|uniref:Uncharacterized protein n=1 Tax=Sesamum radiatum TaxID=300843 RepID=A0AAW2PKV8_SESRA